MIVEITLRIKASEDSGLPSDPYSYFYSAFESDEENDLISVEEVKEIV